MVTKSTHLRSVRLLQSRLAEFTCCTSQAPTRRHIVRSKTTPPRPLFQWYVSVTRPLWPGLADSRFTKRDDTATTLRKIDRRLRSPGKAGAPSSAYRAPSDPRNTCRAPALSLSPMPCRRTDFYTSTNRQITASGPRLLFIVDPGNRFRRGVLKPAMAQATRAIYPPFKPR